MKEVYVLATEQSVPPSLDALRAAFATDEVEFVPHEGDWGFTVRADGSEVKVVLKPLSDGRPRVPQELFSGSPEAFARVEKSQACYAFLLEPGGAQPTLPVFEALWTVRTLMEQAPGVLVDLTAFKLHEPEDVVEITELDFDIRDHVHLHAIELAEGDTPLWVHSHGMEKFGARDVEIFHLGEGDLLAAESFLHELCTDLAFAQGPALRSEVATSEGQSFTLVPSEEARANLLGVPLDAFEGHEGLFLTVVSPLGRHNTAELLATYRERFAKEPAEQTQAMHEEAQALLPAFLARFQRKGLMEPLTFLVRAPFETHPEGEVVVENLWLEAVTRDEGSVVGRLVDGAVHTTEWRKGAHVEVEEKQINALAIAREGRALNESELRALLNAERPM
ncbi:hypothetical protein COCOR_03076 [Corallococcus coralloides DSM 2259]|uniref:DUF2314 domain-containing protein n=1 Tax=Corallococcus coralloides (strain ATCC 25202 / DSM 2259 / NBRC 100086 / M2) TaxID=1144275 RepID=H8N1Q3_CORCM|nr:DUF2314 domain-containing protein [Corallococcus coralloides]AFE04991.1 hypothetical protein COCOR_03076 [Corallococcus coralloides DSM 2259]